jgi:hypothetical protein
VQRAERLVAGAPYIGGTRLVHNAFGVERDERIECARGMGARQPRARLLLRRDVAGAQMGNGLIGG